MANHLHWTEAGRRSPRAGHSFSWEKASARLRCHHAAFWLTSEVASFVRSVLISSCRVLIEAGQPLSLRVARPMFAMSRTSDFVVLDGLRRGGQSGIERGVARVLLHHPLPSSMMPTMASQVLPRAGFFIPSKISSRRSRCPSVSSRCSANLDRGFADHAPPRRTASHYPFAGSRMLRDFLNREGVSLGRAM